MPKQKYYNGSAWVEIDYSASKVGIVDSGNKITATEVEGALQEIAGTTNTNNSTITSHLADDAAHSTLFAAKVNTSDVVTSAAANKILKLDSNSKLPASITGDAVTVGGLSPSVFAKMVTGTYTGDGTSDRFINVGVTPKFIVVSSSTQVAFQHTSTSPILGDRSTSGTTVSSMPASSVYLPQITSNGFTLTSSGVADSFNGSGTLYTYLVIY